MCRIYELLLKKVLNFVVYYEVRRLRYENESLKKALAESVPDAVRYRKGLGSYGRERRTYRCG